uniref:ubiquitinyl hydrolase 1 n=1 Tax=Tabanus bromius TaxID=304241 RepID=A0A0K8TMR7_TABBR
MTIKPLINQKPTEKKEPHGHQDVQTQSMVSNVRTTHRSVVLGNKSNVDSQNSQNRADLFDDMTRLRRSVSSTRPKRDHHHKREQRESNQHHLQGICSSSHASAASVKSPKHVSSVNSTAAPQAGINLNLADDNLSGYNSGDEHLGGKEDLTPDEWKSRDEQFITAMSERGFIVQDIVEDGACLFRAVSLQIYGDQEMHEVIRQQTMDYIYQNREYFAHFVTEDITNYVRRKRCKNSHGNHIEIQAMSEIYNRPVELYCYKTTPINIFNSEQLQNGYDPLRLSYQRGSHYNAIIDPYNASVGVGLGLAGYKPESQTREAIKLSEQLEIEQTMLEDKIKTTDWEATNEAIEEQVARESYLQWCRENMQSAKSSLNSTSSTVTSAEANSENFNYSNICGSTSYTETCSKDNMQFHTTSASNTSCTSDQIPIEQAKLLSPKTKNSEGNSECCESDDTDMSSASSIEQYRDKIILFNTSNKLSIGNHKRLKRRRNIHDKTSNNTLENTGESTPKRLKHRNNRLNLVGDNEQLGQEFSLNDSNSRTTYLPGTSKDSRNEGRKPVSQFYQSLLESSYADDGEGQLSENEMVLRAIQMSRIDFLENHKRKTRNKPESPKKVYLPDEDSDTHSS